MFSPNTDSIYGNLNQQRQHLNNNLKTYSLKTPQMNFLHHSWTHLKIAPFSWQLFLRQIFKISDNKHCSGAQFASP